MRDFTSAWSKWERAETHIAEFNRERIAFLDKNPCVVRAQYNAETAHTDYIVEHVEKVPATISLVVGDAVHNLRSSLDHIAAALVDKSTTQSGFPIFKDSDAFNAGFAGKTKGMSALDQERIWFIKPHLCGSNTLWGLHRLDIADKHHLLIAYTQCAGAVEHRFDETDVITANGIPMPLPRKIALPLLGKLPIPECGKVVVSYPGNPEENKNIKPLFDIAFGDVPVFKYWLIGKALTEMAKEVERIYLAFTKT